MNWHNIEQHKAAQGRRIKIAAMLKRGLTLEAIGRRLHITKQRVHQLIKGLDKNRT